MGNFMSNIFFYNEMSCIGDGGGGYALHNTARYKKE